MPKLHTDREILRCIFDMYRNDYPSKGDPLIEIDMHAVAKRLKCPPELLFGRLHYDMGTRLRWRDPKEPNVTRASIYEKAAGDRRNVVNFPYLTAVLSGLESENRRAWVAVLLSIVAVVVSLAGVGVQYAVAERPADKSAESSATTARGQ